MASTVWKGFLTFGLVSIPVKMYRAARPDKVSFRQLQAGTGARVRQTLVATGGAAPAREADEESNEDEPEPEPASLRSGGGSGNAALANPSPFLVTKEAASDGLTSREAEEPEQPREISRADTVKGYEYAKDQYVTVTKEDLAKITPQTAREMQILEFVKLGEVDPIYFETSYYAAPDKGGEKAYSLLFAALKDSGFVGLAQVAMHNREHVVVIRPGRHGIILHTMFYESEIRQDEEFRAETKAVSQKELDLALLLVKNLEAPFEPAKYHDSYKEKLDALIQAKIAGEETVSTPAPKTAAVVNILEALQKSLEASGRKAPAREEQPAASHSKSQPAAKKRKKA